MYRQAVGRQTQYDDYPFDLPKYNARNPDKNRLD
jgi:hypothetical protein